MKYWYRTWGERKQLSFQETHHMVETQTFITFAVYNIRDATSTIFLQQIIGG